MLILVLVYIIFAGARSAARHIYGHLDEKKQRKCAVYMMEVIMETFAVVWAASHRLFELLAFPDRFQNLTPNDARILATGLSVVMGTIVGTYILEFTFLQDDMRFSLKAHHWSTIILCLMAPAAIYDTNYDHRAPRIVFILSLYMSTEQNVFLTMLAYRMGLVGGKLPPSIFKASAWFYVVTRIAICVLLFWAWVETTPLIWTRGRKAPLTYTIYFIVPLLNIVLNVAQVETASVLLGIANSSGLPQVDTASILRGIPNSASLAKPTETDDDGEKGDKTIIELTSLPPRVSSLPCDGDDAERPIGTNHDALADDAC